jgi:hypothetical protein
MQKTMLRYVSQYKRIGQLIRSRAASVSLLLAGNAILVVLLFCAGRERNGYGFGTEIEARDSLNVLV